MPGNADFGKNIYGKTDFLSYGGSVLIENFGAHVIGPDTRALTVNHLELNPAPIVVHDQLPAHIDSHGDAELEKPAIYPADTRRESFASPVHSKQLNGYFEFVRSSRGLKFLF